MFNFTLVNNKVLLGYLAVMKNPSKHKAPIYYYQWTHYELNMDSLWTHYDPIMDSSWNHYGLAMDSLQTHW